MRASELPPIFAEIVDDPHNALVERALAAGRQAIGYTCSYLPEALLAVDGLVPLRVRAPAASGTPMADTYLSSVLCPYARSLLEYALEGRYDHLGGWVIAASCDHIRRFADNLEYLRKPGFSHVVDVPHKVTESSLQWYEEELRRLAAALSSHFGVDTGPAALAKSIRRYNAQLALLRTLAESRQRPAPPLSGTAFHQVLVAGGMAPRDLLDDALRELCAGLDEREGIDDYRARLLVVGSQLDEPEFLKVIESQGALVVADRFCVGSLPGVEPIPEDGEPLRALAEHSLRLTRCPRMMADFDGRLAHILDLADEYRVDGIVIQTMKFCDLWGMESSALRRALRQTGRPVLRVEREYAHGGEGQLRTRIQAFLESLGT